MSSSGKTESPIIDSNVPRQPYQFSPEELEVLKECRRESFYQRCLPLSTLFSTGVYVAVQNGLLKPSLKYGALPKVCGAVVLGYIIGKASYQWKCAEKMMELPNSELGAMLRLKRRRGGGFQETLTLDTPGFNPAVDKDNVYSDLGPQSYTDLDMDRPFNDGLEQHRPTLDDQYSEDKLNLPESPQQRPMTYEELRRKNREEYEKKKLQQYRGVLSQDDVHPSQKRPPPDHDPIDILPYKPLNKYGDIFDK